MSSNKINLDEVCDTFAQSFLRIVRLHFVFHSLSFLLTVASFIFFSYVLVTTPRSLLLAISLAILIVSIFSYAILRLYFQAHKPEQFHKLRATFFTACTASMPSILTPHERSLTLASAAYKMSTRLVGIEHKLLLSTSRLPSITRLFKKLGSFLFFRDVLLIRELFLLLAVDEHIAIVKKQPTDLEVHASLAHAYLALSRLYQDFAEKFHEESSAREALNTKFVKAVESATEEFSIIDHYAPNDPWVHAQLASSYHALGKFEKELEEYEHILTLCPNDREIMHRLGILYFKLGKSAKGLEIYESLKKAGHANIQELINHYDAHLRGA